MFLYVITNLVNSKRYIGITVDFERRWREHCAGHGSKLVYQAVKKHGIDNIKFEVVCKATEDYVKEMEVKFIASLVTIAYSGYNLTEGGEGSTGWKASDETRKRMSAAHLGKMQPHLDATKRKIGESRRKYHRGQHPRARKITIDGKQYECLRDAAEAIEIPYSTLCVKQRKTRASAFNYHKGVLTPITPE
jgi:group I intron endonuclease